jgi:hypothetical protein
LSARAQSTPQEAAQIGEQDISYDVSPQIPGAFQDVTITASSYLTDVNRAFFIWKQDGKTALSGTGSYAFTFKTGDIGSKTTVEVMMLLVTGETIDKIFTFSPAETDLIWEGADTYTPPFYRGRSLPTSESFIRVVAIPQLLNGTSVTDTKNYVFHWKRNDNVLESASGFAKNVLLIQQDYLNQTENVDVVAEDNSTSATAEGTETIPVFNPKIELYTSDPLSGIDWDHALSNSYNVTSAEKTIIAIPYFFSPADPLSTSLGYTWTINGDAVDTPAIKNVLTLKSGGTDGVSSLKLTIENTVKLFVEAEKDITINLSK